MTTHLRLVVIIVSTCINYSEEWNYNRRSMDIQAHRHIPSTTEPQNTKKRCCPYDFDSTICRTVGDRIICGYNKNNDTCLGKEGKKKLTEDCYLKNGRVECGYENGPFDNPRRPPAWDHGEGNHDYPGPIPDLRPTSQPTHQPYDPCRRTGTCG